MPAISVVICTFNGADTIEAVCRSAAFADELLVVDSGSTDGTLDIVRPLAGRVLIEPFRGFTRQKQWAAEQARNDWVFILDQDEEIGPVLAQELKELKDQPEARLASVDLMLCRRRNYVMSRRVRSWWPDWQSRLIHRRKVRWADDIVNDSRLPSEPGRVGRLRGWLEHRRNLPRWKDFFDGKLANQRVVLMAGQLHRRGKRCRWIDMAFRPVIAFIKHYLIKGAILDGRFGLMMSQKAAMAVHLKYAALWAMEQGYLRLEDVDARGDRKEGSDQQSEAGNG